MIDHLRPHVTPVLALAVAALAIGCATPTGKSPAGAAAGETGDFATVLGTSPQGLKRVSPSRERISITAIDRKSTTPWYSLRSYPTEAQIKPGQRRVDIRYEHVHGVADGTLWVDAKAGRTYRVKVMNPQKRTERVYFLIEDITAQTMVGGESRGDAAP